MHSLWNDGLILLSALSLEGEDKDTLVNSSDEADEDSDDVSIPSNEEHKAGHRGDQRTSYVDSVKEMLSIF